MKIKTNILLDRFFLFSLLILIINDFYLKHVAHNFITGKLSDFAGLFVFTLFFIALFPGNRKIVSFFIILFFVFWKSSFFQPVIDFWNSLNTFQITRTVDYTDLLALPMVWLAYKYSLTERKSLFKKYLTIPVAAIALFSFCATSYSHNYEINKSFELSLSEQEVIERINDISSGCSDYKPLSTDVRLADSSWIDFSMDTVYYSLTGYTHYIDTMWNYDNSGNKTTVDTIYYYKYPQIDTMFVSSSGFFVMHFNVRELLDLKPENYCECVEARCRISDKLNGSVLTLLSVDSSPCSYIDPGNKGKDELIDAFQKMIIEKLSQ